MPGYAKRPPDIAAKAILTVHMVDNDFPLKTDDTQTRFIDLNDEN